MKYDIRPAGHDDIPAIKEILSSVNLPTDDVEHWSNTFLVLHVGGEAGGCVGLEVRGKTGLLRSLAVRPELQGRGFGQRLFDASMSMAERLKLEEVVLLTDSATPLFRKNGFVEISREEAPAAAKASIEFEIHECNDAVVMMKPIKAVTDR